jgi:hypothetical protein
MLTEEQLRPKDSGEGSCPTGGSPYGAVRRGWVPDDLTGCPETALDWLAHGLALDPTTVADLLAAYGGWQGETRRKHRGLVLARLRWRLCGAGERKLQAAGSVSVGPGA